MRILVVMDPIERVDVDRDTTFGFMLAAQARGHEVFYCNIWHLYIRPDGGAGASAWPVEICQRPTDFYSLGEAVDDSLDAYDSIWMRKDPPFDQAFLTATLILDRACDTQVINRPQGLRDANEKLYALEFHPLTPPTLVTREPDRVKAWLAERTDPLVVKPVDGHGGFGVFFIEPGDRNAGSILETLTGQGQRWIVAQPYLPAARDGDKRIILIDGQPVGAILRVPRNDDHRGNIHVGGRVEATELTDRDREICAAVGTKVREDGLWFVGIDVIGEYLTEVNVTSPTGIREVRELGGPDLGEAFVRWVEENPDRR